LDASAKRAAAKSLKQPGWLLGQTAI
jgi:hypothetical protein